jgi:hypothetical protein
LGHEVLAIVKTDAPYFDKALELGIEVRKIPNNFGDYDFFAAKKIQNILEEFNSKFKTSKPEFSARAFRPKATMT